MSHTLAAQSNGVKQTASSLTAFRSRDTPAAAAAAAAADAAAAAAAAAADVLEAPLVVLTSCKAAVARDETGGDASLGLIGRPSTHAAAM